MNRQLWIPVLLFFRSLKIGLNLAFVLTPKSAVKSSRQTRRIFSAITISVDLSIFLYIYYTWEKKIHSDCNLKRLHLSFRRFFSLIWFLQFYIVLCRFASLLAPGRQSITRMPTFSSYEYSSNILARTGQANDVLSQDFITRKDESNKRSRYRWLYRCVAKDRNLTPGHFEGNYRESVSQWVRERVTYRMIQWVRQRVSQWVSKWLDR